MDPLVFAYESFLETCILYFRTLDGRLNNPKKIFNGAAGENLIRLAGNGYADKVYTLSGACTKQQIDAKTCPFPKENNGTGSNRPNPRVISNTLFRQVCHKPFCRLSYLNQICLLSSLHQIWLMMQISFYGLIFVIQDLLGCHLLIWCFSASSFFAISFCPFTKCFIELRLKACRGQITLNIILVSLLYDSELFIAN